MSCTPIAAWTSCTGTERAEPGANVPYDVCRLRPGGMLSFREVLDHCVTRGEEQPDVTVVAPLHEIRRRAVGAVNLENLRVAVGLTDVVSFDDQPVSY